MLKIFAQLHVLDLEILHDRLEFFHISLKAARCRSIVRTCDGPDHVDDKAGDSTTYRYADRAGSLPVDVIASHELAATP